MTFINCVQLFSYIEQSENVTTFLPMTERKVKTCDKFGQSIKTLCSAHVRLNANFCWVYFALIPIPRGRAGGGGKSWRVLHVEPCQHAAALSSHPGVGPAWGMPVKNSTCKCSANGMGRRRGRRQDVNGQNMMKNGKEPRASKTYGQAFLLKGTR